MSDSHVRSFKVTHDLSTPRMPELRPMSEFESMEFTLTVSTPDGRKVTKQVLIMPGGMRVVSE